MQYKGATYSSGCSVNIFSGIKQIEVMDPNGIMIQSYKLSMETLKEAETLAKEWTEPPVMSNPVTWPLGEYNHGVTGSRIIVYLEEEEVGDNNLAIYKGTSGAWVPVNNTDRRYRSEWRTVR